MEIGRCQTEIDGNDALNIREHDHGSGLPHQVAHGPLRQGNGNKLAVDMGLGNDLEQGPFQLAPKCPLEIQRALTGTAHPINYGTPSSGSRLGPAESDPYPNQQQ